MKIKIDVTRANYLIWHLRKTGEEMIEKGNHFLKVANELEQEVRELKRRK